MGQSKIMDSSGRECAILWEGDIFSEDVPETTLFVTDPPYNIGVNYSKSVDDLSLIHI